MAHAGSTHAAALDRLLAADRIEVAASLLVNVFAGEESKPYPSVTDYKVTMLLAARYGIVLKSALTWNPRREPDGTVLRIAIDVQEAWRGAGLTGRGSIGEGGHEVLLLRGERLLAADNPYQAVCAALERSGAARSFV